MQFTIYHLKKFFFFFCSFSNFLCIMCIVCVSLIWLHLYAYKENAMKICAAMQVSQECNIPDLSINSKCTPCHVDVDCTFHNILPFNFNVLKDFKYTSFSSSTGYCQWMNCIRNQENFSRKPVQNIPIIGVEVKSRFLLQTSSMLIS